MLTIGSSNPEYSSEQQRRRVLIYSEFRVLLDALDGALRPAFEIGTAHNCDSFLSAVENGATDAAVVGLDSSVEDRFRAIGMALERRPNLPIVLLSTDGASVNPRQAAQIGAKAYCYASQPLQQFVSNIDRVLNGESLIPETAHANPIQARMPVRELLTARQIEVLRLIANGGGAKEIANALGISVRTAEFHRAAIMDRLELRSTAQLTRYALENGIC